MQTKEIQRTEWSEFFDDFSRTHRGSRVGIEILGRDIGAQTEEIGLELEGITAESDEVLGDTIFIMVGANAPDHLTHSIRHATKVSLEQDEFGTDVALAIKAVDGSTALLRFQPTALPEIANAVAS